MTTAGARVGRARTLAAALAIGVVALALRLRGADYSLWYDEVASTAFARVPLRLLWSGWMVRETNPPLYYTLLGAWSTLFGGGDRALRALSIVFGIASLVPVFLLGRIAAGARAGLLAMALVACSAPHILYSQQVRGYALGYMLTAAALLGAILFVTAPARRPDRSRLPSLLLYVLCSIGAVYSHTTLILAPFLMSVFVIGLLGARRSYAAAGWWVAGNIILLAAWAWWARITLMQATHGSTIGWMARPSLPYAIRIVLESALPWHVGIAQYVGALLATGAFLYGAYRLRRRPEMLVLPFIAVAAPVSLYLVSFVVPVMMDRTVWWSTAPLLVTIAVGVAAIPSTRLFLGGSGIGVALSLWAYAVWYPDREIEPWRAIVETVSRRDPGAPVVARGRGLVLALRRYCVRPSCTLKIVGIDDPGGNDSWTSGFAVPGILPADAAPALVTRGGRVVTVRWLGADPLSARTQPSAGIERRVVYRSSSIEVTEWRAARP